MTALLTYTLRLADDALICAQRLSEWVSNAPEIETDIAFANVALDQLGQARAFYQYASTLDPAGRSEDDFAYLRDERDFVNCLLVEAPNTDFAHAVIRQLILSATQCALYDALAASSDAMLAAIAGKASKEVRYHVELATVWTLRLGDGTDESHARAQEALDALWPYIDELFETDEVVAELVRDAVAPDPAALRPSVDDLLTSTLARATLEPVDSAWRPTGGRRGLHTEPFGYLLAEMQYLARAHPGARW